MWVVKLGGSLCNDTLLPQWLDLLAELGGGRVTVVSGGGAFADEVRRAQSRWQFDDLAAHNMAVLAMAQSAYQFNALNPSLHLATRKSDIRRVLHSGRTALWLPLEAQRDEPDAHTHWGNSADSLALDLARKLNAERLVVIKSCMIDPQLNLAQLSAAGVLDTRFPSLAEGVPFPIDLMNKEELGRMRSLLIGEDRYLSA